MLYQVIVMQHLEPTNVLLWLWNTFDVADSSAIRRG